jgi:hypothetical protein
VCRHTQMVAAHAKLSKRRRSKAPQPATSRPCGPAGRGIQPDVTMIKGLGRITSRYGRKRTEPLIMLRSRCDQVACDEIVRAIQLRGRVRPRSRATQERAR